MFSCSSLHLNVFVFFNFLKPLKVKTLASYILTLLPFSFQPPLHHFFSLSPFFLSLTLEFYSFLFFSAPTPSLTPYPQPTFFLTSHSLHSSEFSPPFLSPLHMPLHTSTFLHRPPHAGLNTLVSTRRAPYTGLIFSFSRSHDDPLSPSL